MIQEKNDLILGLELNRDYAQLSCYDGTTKEPVTLGNGSEEDKYSIPAPKGLWDAVDQSTGAGNEDTIRQLSEFLGSCLHLLGDRGTAQNIRIMVTVRLLTSPWSVLLPKALERLGIERKNVFLQDYKSSFYAYTINQKRELWNGDVALLEYEEETMVSYVLHVDKSTRPALVTVEKTGEQLVSSRIRGDRDDETWDKERDRLLFELLKKTFERRNVTTCFLVGDYFDRDWAERSFQYLCSHRHAFQGKNLYTKGACYAAMERMGLQSFPDMLFMGSDIVRENIGMYLRIRGKQVYYPLVTAGVNWYEAHHVCELIPNGEQRLTLITKPMTGGQEVMHILRLTDFPKRANRATRLRLTLYFVTAGKCVVEVEDMGFGGFYKPSGKKWKREIHLCGEGGGSVEL